MQPRVFMLFLRLLRTFLSPRRGVPQGDKSGFGIDANSKDGWLIYDEEAEFVRQGLIKPKSLDS